MSKTEPHRTSDGRYSFTVDRLCVCGHAESAHKPFRMGDGERVLRCLHWHKCQCSNYVPVPDPEAHNTVDGRPPIELYEFQKSYLRGLPAKYIFAADTGCFAAGTRVLTALDTYRNIEDVKKGDLLLAWDGNYFKEVKVDFVQRTSNKPKPMIEFEYAQDGDYKTIRATYDHPFFDGERYYPLYEFVWRNMASSQRIQLQLLCEQYGARFDNTPSRGISGRDNPTSERQFWSLANSNEWQDSQNTPSSSTKLDTEPDKFAIYKSQGLRPHKQSDGQSGMVQPETEQSTRLRKRTVEQITQNGASGENQVQRPDATANLGLVGQQHRQHADNKYAYQTKDVHGVRTKIQHTPFSPQNRRSEAVHISKVKVLKAEPYYAIGIKNSPHTYIVETLPVHNTGKTYMALAHYDKHAYLKPLLILAPASKVNTGDWERELKEWFAGRLLPEYEIYSYEKFSRMPTAQQYAKTGVLSVWHDYLKRHPDGDFAVICDEIHKAKNSQSGIGKRVFEVGRQAPFFCGLSATPLPNGWQDAMNYFKIFGYVKNKTEFKNRYIDEVTYKGFPEIRGYFREDELQERWNKIAKPLSKDKALDLPPVVSVPVTLEAGKEYLRIMRDRTVGDIFLDNPSALTNALRQSIIEPKIKWLENFLDGASDNVVVFYNYIEEREQMLKMLKKSHPKRKVFRIDGEKHQAPNKSEWQGLERTITLAQYQSGSTGIELTYAATTVYLSPTYSYSNFEQSIGRTNRNGQTRKMTLYMLCAPTTLEKNVWAALRDKKDFQTTQWYDNVLQIDNKEHTVVLGVNDVY